MTAAPTLDRVAVALDTADRAEFARWAALFGPRVGVLKVGLEAFARWGPEAIAVARRHARQLFLDLKLHDIPATVGGAVAAARDHGADYLTLHAAGGRAMLEAAAAAGGGMRLLAVTLLTSLDEAALAELDLHGPAGERAARWAALAASAGCAGVVCSPQEVAALRAARPRPFLLVTPGIRAPGQPAGDQRRTATAAATVAAGADLLVIGRPLTRAADPEAALAALADELARNSPEPRP